MLARGARIAVVSPSGIHDPDKLALGLQVLRDWGYTPQLMPAVGSAHRYFGGTDEARLADFVAAFSGEWDAVWMARGGYGAGRIAERVPWDRLAPVPLLGFSDGTVLLNRLAALGRPAIHAPVLNALGSLNDEASRAHLKSVLEGENSRLEGGWLIGGGEGIEGPVVGGNLCVMASLAGTPLAVRGRDGIVLVEEIGEAPYKIDRLLWQCRESGVFDGARAIVLGDFVEYVNGFPRRIAAPPDAGWTLDEVFVDLLGPLGIPVLSGLPVGHGVRNFALPFGTRARFEGATLVVDPTTSPSRSRIA